MPYSPLNTITAYQFGDSILLPSSYVTRCKELGFSACGIADSNRYAYPSFAESCAAQGRKPVFGLRISLSSAVRGSYQGVLYIKNEQGYKNLCLLVSRQEGIYGTDLLSQYQEGLILVLVLDDPLFYQEEYQKRVSKELFAYSKVFGGDFYLGVSLESKADREESETLYRFIDEREYQSLAFPLARYLYKNDAGSYDLFHCAVHKLTYVSKGESGPEFLLSSFSAEKTYRKKEIQSASDRLKKIDFTFFIKRGSLIRFEKEDEELKRKATEGLSSRFSGKNIPKAYSERLAYELSVIRERKFSSYFLLVCDYVSQARKRGIYVGPGRGSAGGSLVSYSLGITQIDPIQYSLSFERFLNPKRKTRPDIDRDFEDTRRREVVNYLFQRYGERHCSDIVTFSTLKPRSALTLVGTALNYPPSRRKPLTSLLPEQAPDFSSALKERRFYQKEKFEKLRKDDYYANLVKKATAFLSLPINTSIHAAGIILSQEEIYKNVPLNKGRSGTALYEYPYREKLGFLKVDILSLGNLSFIHQIEDKRKADGISLPSFMDDLENPKVYEEINALHLCRIFQLDNSKGIKKAIEEITPDSFKDIASLLALYRPGPRDYISSFAKRKKGREKIAYPSKVLEPILKDTYGIRVYQEQVRQSVMVLAGFSASDADLFRRAISKKDIGKRKQYEPLFYLGTKKNGLDDATAKGIYQDILKFAGYGFNKSHAYCYSLITYQLLYYKALYPKEFYECAFSSTSFGSAKSIQLRQELKDKGITRGRVDVNLSLPSHYQLVGKTFRIPLSCVKQTDRKVLDLIVEARKERGAFLSFYDFFVKLDGKISSSSLKTIYALIEAGAFDSLSPFREGRKKCAGLYLSYASMSFPPEQVPAIEERKQDEGIVLRQEKSAIGLIRSRRLSSLCFRKGYKTRIVSDVSLLSNRGRITAITEIGEYTLLLRQKADREKGGILLIPDEDFHPEKSWLYPKNYIYQGKEEK